MAIRYLPGPYKALNPVHGLIYQLGLIIFMIIGEEISFPPDTGLLIENPAFINEFSGFKNLKLVAEIRHKISGEAIENAITAVGLDPKDHRSFRKYSLGMKQRLGIAAAIMEDPELIILDEPFNALDSAGVAMISELILNLKEQGKLIILACHDKTMLETVADVIIPMKNGDIGNVGSRAT